MAIERKINSLINIFIIISTCSSESKKSILIDKFLSSSSSLSNISASTKSIMFVLTNSIGKGVLMLNFVFLSKDFFHLIMLRKYF